jgi:predicted MFS family arabinose efflux permease
MKAVFTYLFRTYRDAYSGHPKQVWALALLTLINRAGTMVLPFLSVYISTVLGFSLKETGLIISAFGMGSFLGAYFGGKLSDIIGANRVIQISLFMGGLMFLGLEMARTSWELFGMIFLSALFGEAYRPAVNVSIANYVSAEQRGRTISLIRLAINLGMSLAPAVGGWIAIAYGYSWLFWIDGTTCIIAALFFVWVSRNWVEKKRQEKTERNEGKALETPPLRNPDYLVFLLVSFIMAFAFLQWFHTVPVFIKTEWNFDERYIGALMATSSLMVSVIEMPLIHEIERLKQRRRSLFTGMVLIGGAYLIFELFPWLGFCFIAVIIWTMGEILFLPINNSMAINLSPEFRRGDYMALYFMSWSLANIAAPTVGLSIAEQLGFQSFWWMLFALVIGGVFLLSRQLGLKEK